MTSSTDLLTALLAERERRKRKRAKEREYRPRGAAAALQQDTSPEVVLSGPAGTGKSRACLERLHQLMQDYPGARALIVRKTRASLSESGLVTYEQHVLGPGSEIAQGPQRQFRQAYRYPNGSTVVIGGLDRPTRIMSTEYDLIYVQEATELTENDWESLTTRLRNGRMPWQQIIADCNPDAPTHWLKRRADSGKTRMLESRHEDNPLLWDAGRGEWTPKGREYIAKLDNLSGARYLRLRKGIWAAAEGAVYEEFDRALHLIDRFEIPSEWRRIRVIDFGFTNPFVCHWWAIDPDGRMYLYREIYMSQRLVEDHARQINELSRDEFIEATIADHDAEDRATLERHGIPTVAAEKSVTRGIQAVQARLRKAGDGKPRLYIMRDSLVERDDRLEEAKKPWCTEQEFDSYVWHKGQDGKPVKEEPVKVDDHGMDTMRYAVAYLDVAAEFWLV